MIEHSNSNTLEPVPEGFRTRLRYGNNKRDRFTIRLKDAQQAERRRKALQSIANTLAKAGKHTEAPIILRKGAEVTTEREFQEVVRFVDGLCPQSVRAELRGPTVQELGDDWTSGKLHEKYPDHVKAKRTSEDDKQRLTTYVYPIIGHKRVADVTLDDCEAVMRELPGKLSTMTRRNVGQTLVRVLNMAVFPLRHIERSPLPAGFLPKMPKAKAMAYLYPDEERRLMECKAIPIAYRLLWGFFCREGMRESEALALTFRDLDLSRGAVKLDKNKTDDPRAWALAPGVAAALKVYREKYRASSRRKKRITA